MGEVVSHLGETVLDAKNQNADCIEYLEHLLTKARDGEVCGIAVAIQYTDLSNSEATAGYLRNRSVVGSLHYLMMRVGGA